MDRCGLGAGAGMLGSTPGDSIARSGVEASGAGGPSCGHPRPRSPRPPGDRGAFQPYVPTVIYDACVLYPAPLRDLLLRPSCGHPRPPSGRRATSALSSPTSPPSRTRPPPAPAPRRRPSLGADPVEGRPAGSVARGLVAGCEQAKGDEALGSDCFGAHPCRVHVSGVLCAMIRAVELAEHARKQLRKVPKHIAVRLSGWIELVEEEGLAEAQKRPGLHDVPLKGSRQGQRSIRLNRAYRAIYRIVETGKLEVARIEEVNKHDY